MHTDLMIMYTSLILIRLRCHETINIITDYLIWYSIMVLLKEKKKREKLQNTIKQPLKDTHMN